jgi:hypothetical protein
MKPTALHRKMFRLQVLDGTGITGPLDAFEELKRSRFFIETMEEFISSSETAEVKELEARVQALSDDAKDEFWQWHYPIHWQDIFGVRVRSAFCALLCSQVEATLCDIARRVNVIERSAIQVKNLKGSTLEQHKLYLEAFAKFDGPSPELWKEMGFVFRVRNSHVHQQGYAGEIADDRGFAQFLASLPDVATQNNFIELKAGSCIALLEIAERFHAALLSEYEAYRQRAQALERLSRPEDA